MIRPFGGRRMPAPEASVCVRSNPMAPRASWKGYLFVSNRALSGRRELGARFVQPDQ
jgi:hypothetical protein